MLFFFFKQKTAYEMRISDWSSDVCSSDLRRALRDFRQIAQHRFRIADAAAATYFGRRRALAEDLCLRDQRQLVRIEAKAFLQWCQRDAETLAVADEVDRKSTRLNSSH